MIVEAMVRITTEGQDDKLVYVPDSEGTLVVNRKRPSRSRSSKGEAGGEGEASHGSGRVEIGGCRGESKPLFAALFLSSVPPSYA